MESGDSKITTNHDEIKKWVEDRDGKPALVKGTGDNGKGGGLLRINFQDEQEEDLENIEWQKFFTIFDEDKLKFLYQENTKDGSESRFFKFVNK